MAPREPSVHPKHSGGCGEYAANDRSFGGEAGPKNLQIADRGKPEPVDHDLACDLDEPQGNDEDDGRNDPPCQDASPRDFASGSGNLERHDPIIAESDGACRVVRRWPGADFDRQPAKERSPAAARFARSPFAAATCLAGNSVTCAFSLVRTAASPSLVARQKPVRLIAQLPRR